MQYSGWPRMPDAPIFNRDPKRRNGTSALLKTKIAIVMASAATWPSAQNAAI